MIDMLSYCADLLHCVYCEDTKEGRESTIEACGPLWTSNHCHHILGCQIRHERGGNRMTRAICQGCACVTTWSCLSSSRSARRSSAAFWSIRGCLTGALCSK